MHRLGGHPGAIHARRVSPLTLTLLLLVALTLVGLAMIAAAIVIPLAVVAGLGFAGYRALTRAARRKTNEILNRDDDGRKNVRVRRTGEPTPLEEGSSRTG